MDKKLLSRFEQQIKLKKQQFSTENRKVLLTALQRQYQEVKIAEKLEQHIKLLAQDNTFTVTTGHQLCLLTGPLYFIYKILHVIKLTEALKEQFPHENFVPVYWMASEDHDFEEIRSFLLFGQKWSWESSQKGAVGRFHIDELIPLLNQLAEKFHNHPDSEIHHLLEELKSKNHEVIEVRPKRDTFSKTLSLKNRVNSSNGSMADIYLSIHTNIGGGKSNSISDTTANKAILLAEDERYQYLKKIVETIESVYTSLDREMKNFADERYFSESAAYADWEDVAYEIGVTKPKAFRMRNQLIDITAKKIGWL